MNWSFWMSQKGPWQPHPISSPELLIDGTTVLRGAALWVEYIIPILQIRKLRVKKFNSLATFTLLVNARAKI